MPRYEFSEGSSNKFWEITLKETDVITHYGRIGSDGQSTTKSFKSAAEAKSAYEKLIAEKTKKGYELKSGGSGTATVSKTTAKSDGNPLIDRLDAWLKKARPKFYAKLNKGASAAEIAKLEKLVGELPQTLKDLLSWKNGQNTSSRLIENWGLMNVEDISSTWNTLKELKEDGELESEDHWKTFWVPFMENGGGDHLCIDLKKDGAIREFWHADEDRKVKFPNLDEMLTKILGWLEKSKWSIESGGFVNWGKDFSCDESEEEQYEEERAAKARAREAGAAAVPVAPVGKQIDGLKEKRIGELPDNVQGWPHVSPYGKDYVYPTKKGTLSGFVHNGKQSPYYEMLLGPWFDETTGIMIYKEGVKNKFRWHIGEEVHEYYVRSDNPHFTPDGKHYCYTARKGKKWFLVKDGKPLPETYDFAFNPVLSADGSKYAFFAELDKKKFVVNNGVRESDLQNAFDLVFNADGSKLAYDAQIDDNHHQVWCGSYKSESSSLASTLGFTPTGELWHTFSNYYPRIERGIYIGGKITLSSRWIRNAFFNSKGELSALIEAEDRGSFLVHPGKPAEELPHYWSSLFHAPTETVAVIGDRMTAQEAMGPRKREVLCVNGKETGEYDSIQNARFSADGKSITFGAIRGNDVLWVEMSV